MSGICAASRAGQHAGAGGLVAAALALGALSRRRAARACGPGARPGAAPAWAAAGVALAAGCSGQYDVDRDEPCRNAAYAIASKTHACTGDVDLSNRRYEQARAQFRCTVATPKLNDFLCSSDINDMGCDEVKACGDDLERWLSRPTRSCHPILEHADGRALKGGGGSSSGPDYLPAPDPALGATPVCQKAMALLEARMSACYGAPTTLPGVLSKHLALRRGCAGKADAVIESDPCVLEAMSTPCLRLEESVNPEQDALLFFSRTAACQQLFPELSAGAP